MKALLIAVALAATVAHAETLPPKPPRPSDRVELQKTRSELAELRKRYEALQDRFRTTPQCRRYWTNAKHTEFDA